MRVRPPVINERRPQRKVARRWRGKAGQMEVTATLTYMSGIACATGDRFISDSTSLVYTKEGRGGEAAKNKTLRYWPM